MSNQVKFDLKFDNKLESAMATESDMINRILYFFRKRMTSFCGQHQVCDIWELWRIDPIALKEQE